MAKSAQHLLPRTVRPYQALWESTKDALRPHKRRGASRNPDKNHALTKTVRTGGASPLGKPFFGKGYKFIYDCCGFAS
jgi:hypothetical protein